MRQRYELGPCGLDFLPQGSQVAASGRYLLDQIPEGSGIAGYNPASLIVETDECPAPPPDAAGGAAIAWEYPASKLGEWSFFYVFHMRCFFLFFIIFFSFYLSVVIGLCLDTTC